MVMASKHFGHTSVSVDMRDWEIIGVLSKRTRVSKAHFVREALRSVILKYKGLLADDSSLNLEEYEAAPAHAELLRQKRDPSKAIQPHEGVVAPNVVTMAQAFHEEMRKKVGVVPGQPCPCGCGVVEPWPEVASE